MQNATFQYVEDYIEFIAGLRTLADKSLMFFEKLECPICLARYDVNIIQSLAIQTSETHRPYTDKQAELAIKLIQKYVRQLSNVGVTLPLEFDNFRFGIRQIDRSKKIYIEDNRLLLKFPYDTKILPLVKKYSKESDGSANFDHDSKTWKLALTESMLNWSMVLALEHQFEISNEVKYLYDKILETEKFPYRIELFEIENSSDISNSEQSLKDYIRQNLGGFSMQNLLRLVDNAAVLGYTVHPDLVQKIKNQYLQFWPIICNKDVKLSSKEFGIDTILEYARLTDRLPVYIYDNESKHAPVDKIKYLNKLTEFNIASKLLVTKTSMMIGPKKQSWLANAEKIITLE